MSFSVLSKKGFFLLGLKGQIVSIYAQSFVRQAEYLGGNL